MIEIEIVIDVRTEQETRILYISFFLNGYLSSFSSMSYFVGRVNFVKLIDQLQDKY